MIKLFRFFQVLHLDVPINDSLNNWSTWWIYKNNFLIYYIFNIVYFSFFFTVFLTCPVSMVRISVVAIYRHRFLARGEISSGKGVYRESLLASGCNVHARAHWRNSEFAAWSPDEITSLLSLVFLCLPSTNILVNDGMLTDILFSESSSQLIISSWKCLVLFIYPRKFPRQKSENSVLLCFELKTNKQRGKACSWETGKWKVTAPDKQFALKYLQKNFSGNWLQFIHGHMEQRQGTNSWLDFQMFPWRFLPKYLTFQAEVKEIVERLKHPFYFSCLLGCSPYSSPSGL